MAGSSPHPRATRADVARRAGVSPAAVSAVLSGNKYPTISISAPTRQRILQAARELDYQPNILARNLKEQRSMLLAFLCRQVYRRSHEIMVGMQEALDPTDYSLVHYSRGDTLEAECRHLDLCWQRRVDGILLTPMVSRQGGTNLRKVLELVERGVSIVQLPNDTFPEVPSVTIDFEVAAQLVLEHLMGLGHKRIALVIPRLAEGVPNPAQRAHPRVFVEAYQGLMAAAGLEPTVIRIEEGANLWRNVDRLLGQEMKLAEHIREHPSQPTAIITTHDYPAMALLRAFGRLGVPIPEALSLVGMHNTREGRFPLPALTSVEFHHEQIGALAARMILQQIEGGSVESRQVEPALIVRESTAPPRVGRIEAAS